ncbi:hypothetical protein Bbelb_407770 [Branchiostoma belcheri]|nr:hypothetical protein Bbelb_407770 [Branchiostoma belcheri]
MPAEEPVVLSRHVDKRPCTYTTARCQTSRRQRGSSMYEQFVGHAPRPVEGLEAWCCQAATFNKPERVRLHNVTSGTFNRLGIRFVTVGPASTEPPESPTRIRKSLLRSQPESRD